MSEEVAGVKWKDWGYNQEDIDYTGDGFNVRVDGNNWWAHVDSKFVTDNFAPDHETAKAQAERWILEREGRLPAPATDGSGWIACSERMPAVGVEVEVIRRGRTEYGGWTWSGNPTYWRPRPADPHAVAACLFDGRYRPTVEQARAAARHVAGCAECRERLKAGGGA